MNLMQLRASLAMWRARLKWREMRWNFWRKRGQKQYIDKWNKLRWEAIDRIHLRLKQIEQATHLKFYVMYDTVTLNTVPPNPQAVAGYTSGNWPTYIPLVKKYPRAKHLSIAVSASHDAECLDIENGDASPEQAPQWVRRQHARGVRRPVVYGSVSAMENIINILSRDSIPRNQYRVWTAHYTFVAHLCGPGCGNGFTDHADATQWTDKSHNSNLDESLCAGNFFS